MWPPAASQQKTHTCCLRLIPRVIGSLSRRSPTRPDSWMLFGPKGAPPYTKRGERRWTKDRAIRHTTFRTAQRAVGRLAGPAKEGEIRAMLSAGNGIRKTASALGVGVSVVQRVAQVAP